MAAGTVAGLRRGRTDVLIASHLLAELSEVADDVVVLSRGRVVLQAPLQDLLGGQRRLEDVFLELTEAMEAAS